MTTSGAGSMPAGGAGSGDINILWGEVGLRAGGSGNARLSLSSLTGSSESRASTASWLCAGRRLGFLLKLRVARAHLPPFPLPSLLLVWGYGPPKSSSSELGPGLSFLGNPGVVC